MSKVRCLYCDTVFEYSGQNRCPGCGASLADNPDVENAVRAERERADDAEKIRQQVAGSVFRQVEDAERTGRFISRVFLPVFIIIFITVLVVILVSFLTMRNMFPW